MTLIHVNLASSLGGGEFQTLVLMEQLRSRGFRQHLIARASKPLFQKAVERGFEVSTVFSSLFGLLLRRFTGNDDVIIHAHDGRAAHRAALLSLLGGAPYIITRRILKSPSAGKWTHYAYRNADQVVAVSQITARQMQEWQAGLRVETVYDSLQETVTDDVIVNQLKSSATDRFIVLQAGRLTPEKGADVTLNVARILRSRNVPVIFWIVGDGPERRRLETAAADLDNVCFFGYRDDVGNFLAAADLLLHPVRSEAFGSVLLQAMQHDTVIVASRVGGIPEVLDQGNAGILVTSIDEESFADEVIKLVNNSTRRSALATAGRRQCSQFGAEQMADHYVEMYKHCLMQKQT